MLARKRHLSYLAYNVRIKLACTAATVAFSGRKGLPPLPRFAKRTEIGWQTARLCSKVHRIDRPDRQLRPRSKEEIEHVERR
jgi:hypothetical protein